MVILVVIFLVLVVAYVWTAMKARANVTRIERRAQEMTKIHKDDDRFPR